MKTLAALSFAAATIIATQPIYAEPPSAEDILLGSTVEAPASSAAGSSESLISQTGTGNSALVIQRERDDALSAISLSQSGRDNTAIFLQSGSDNSITSGQTGDANLTVAQQIGLGNVLISQQTGDNLAIIVRQYGGSAVAVTQTGQ